LRKQAKKPFTTPTILQVTTRSHDPIQKKNNIHNVQDEQFRKSLHC
jgi:hypothetical protein